jgi:hemolysin D
MKDDSPHRLRPLTEALEDHGAEGIAVLSAEPWRLAMLTVLTTCALVVCALVWSFVGHADVIVSAQGALAPESEVRRIYAPVDGELADLYIAEGPAGVEGDVLARLNARGAIEAAASALQAQLKLEDGRARMEAIPREKGADGAPRRRAQAQMELEERQHEKRMAEGTGRLAEPTRATGRRRAAIWRMRAVRATPRARSRPLRAPVRAARRRRRVAMQVEPSAQPRRKPTTHARRAVQAGRARCALSQESRRPASSWKPAARSWPSCASSTTRGARGHHTEDKLRLQLQTARLVAEAAARIKFENIDKDNFLLILAPVDRASSPMSPRPSAATSCRPMRRWAASRPRTRGPC